MTKSRRLAGTFLTSLIIPGLLIWYVSKHLKTFTKERVSSAYSSGTVEDAEEQKRLSFFARRLKKFATSHHYSTSTCFFADMKLHSGKYRFFVYDLKKDEIKSAGLVAHSNCKNSFLVTARFSNAPDCNCSSAGKYKVTTKYKGRFGNAFKLVGLDSTNNNAFKRSIVLHGYSCVVDEEIYPIPLCNSLGCPMVSYNFLQTLTKEIEENNKPILLWIIT